MTPMEMITCPCGSRVSLEKAVNIGGFLRCEECQVKIEIQEKESELKNKTDVFMNLSPQSRSKRNKLFIEIRELTREINNLKRPMYKKDSLIEF